MHRELEEVGHNFFGGQMQFNASAITEVQEVLDYQDDQVQKKFPDN